VLENKGGEARREARRDGGNKGAYSGEGILLLEVGVVLLDLGGMKMGLMVVEWVWQVMVTQEERGGPVSAHVVLGGQLGRSGRRLGVVVEVVVLLLWLEGENELAWVVNSGRSHHGGLERAEGGVLVVSG